MRQSVLIVIALAFTGCTFRVGHARAALSYEELETRLRANGISGSTLVRSDDGQGFYL
jgi:hypothetical protein